MSKERAIARAERERQAALRAAQEQERREKEAAERAKRERRRLAWRRVRLWQHGSGYRRNKEGIAGVLTLALVALVLTYVLTSSMTAVIGVLLLFVITAPVLVMLSTDRRRR